MSIDNGWRFLPLQVLVDRVLDQNNIILAMTSHFETDQIVQIRGNLPTLLVSP